LKGRSDLPIPSKNSKSDFERLAVGVREGEKDETAKRQQAELNQSSGGSVSWIELLRVFVVALSLFPRESPAS
jgi:hypothetical protein